MPCTCIVHVTVVMVTDRCGLSTKVPDPIVLNGSGTRVTAMQDSVK